MALRVVVLAVCLLAGCGTKQSALPTALVDADEGRFPHARHEQLACTECHARERTLAGPPQMPGADDHAPCDRQACHQAEFLAGPSTFCMQCHEEVDPDGASPLVPYPPQHGRRALASRFSHALHLDAARMETAVGFHVSCSDCHEVRELLSPKTASHRSCARCHAPEAAAPGAPTMHQCQRCHQAVIAPLRRRELITGDLSFEHQNHRLDHSGELIACTECHVASATTTELVQPPPPTAACVNCHDDPDRAPARVRMRQCEACHATRRDGIGTLAPRSHLPARERPEDHTLAFRTEHGADAQREPTRCASCHTFLSGSPRDTCADCHAVMRPVDHTVSWRELEHGQAAATSTERCTTCHVASFCTTCHSTPPRSHFPRLAFRERGHGEVARVSPRSCVVCHSVERFCASAGCHTTTPGPLR